MIYKDYLFKSRITLMNKGLDAYALRQKVVAKNIANATTPGYTPESVKFEQYFRDGNFETSGIINTNSKYETPSYRQPTIEESVEPTVEENKIPDSGKYFSGESHVNIDKEMSDMAENQIRYRFVSRMMKRYFQGLNSAISGTGG